MRFSYYTYENDLAKGFVTIEGGHRVGVCGKVVQKNGEAALIKERTRKDLEREQAKARDELRKETVQMAVMLAQRFVSASIRPQDQNALIEEALAGVEDAEWKV